MDDKLRKVKEKLQEWEGLMRLQKSQDYQLYLKPILERAFQNLWPAPSESKTYEEFHKQYVEQWGRAMAYKELFNLLENAEALVNQLTKQLKDPTKDYSLGQKNDTTTHKS